MDAALEDYLERVTPRRLFWDGFWLEAQRAGVSRETAAAWCSANTQRIDRTEGNVMGCAALTHDALAEITTKETQHG